MFSQEGKDKGSSLDTAPLTILDRGALQPRKWQLIGTPRQGSHKVIENDTIR